MPAGKKMSKEEFDRLSEKRKVVIIRNRKNALSTRKKRNIEIIKLKRENLTIKAEIKLMERQIPVFCYLSKKDVPDYLDETFHTFVFPLPLIEIRSLENVSDKKMRNRTHAHNNLAKLKNTLNELQITNVLLLDRLQNLRLILDGLIPG